MWSARLRLHTTISGWERVEEWRGGEKRCEGGAAIFITWGLGRSKNPGERWPGWVLNVHCAQTLGTVRDYLESVASGALGPSTAPVEVAISGALHPDHVIVGGPYSCASTVSSASSASMWGKAGTFT